MRSTVLRQASPLARITAGALTGIGLALGAGAVIALAAAVGFGPLNPPGGVVAPSYKTLAAI